METLLADMEALQAKYAANPNAQISVVEILEIATLFKQLAEFVLASLSSTSQKEI